MRKDLKASEVRELPLGTRVRIHSRDRFGFPQWLDCEVVQAGHHKELRFDDLHGFGRKPIRSGMKYTVEVNERE